jgi:hypothetical protein
VAALDSCRFLSALVRDLIEGGAVAVERGFLSGQGLPALHDNVDVLGIIGSPDPSPPAPTHPAPPAIQLAERANAPYSDASKPLSAASAASLRIADILIMMGEDPSPRSSSDTRHALTVALVKPGRGACWNQSINSFSAML